MTRIVRKYGRFGRFPVVEKWVLQYNIEPGTESLDVCKEYRRQGIGTQLMKDMLALLKKRAMREHRWQYKKPIMLSGCTRRSDSGLWMRMTKSLLWCVNYESDQLF